MDSAGIALQPVLVLLAASVLSVALCRRLALPPMVGYLATGLLLGRKPLVQAAWYNGPPHQGFGRAMKISKEQIVGAVAAVERWLDHDRAAEQRRWRSGATTTSTACSFPAPACASPTALPISKTL